VRRGAKLKGPEVDEADGELVVKFRVGLINEAVSKLLLEEETTELMTESVTIVEVDRISEVDSDTMKSNRSMFGRVLVVAPLCMPGMYLYIKGRLHVRSTDRFTTSIYRLYINNKSPIHVQLPQCILFITQ
jgi:hypothetical protein